MRRAAERLADSILFTPLVWLGNSDHHLDFTGTLSARPRVYLDMLGGVLDDWIRHGFRRLVLVNGHGGNDVPGRQTIFEIRQKHRTRDDLLLLCATYWQVGPVPELLLNGLHQKQMGHACEWETSMMLHLNPQLVGDYKKLSPVVSSGAFRPVPSGWITKDITVEGHIGSPHLATVEKGAALFDAFAENMVGFLEKVVRWDGRNA